jgi:hypothetical protein
LPSQAAGRCRHRRPPQEAGSGRDGGHCINNKQCPEARCLNTHWLAQNKAAADYKYEVRGL